MGSHVELNPITFAKLRFQRGKKIKGGDRRGAQRREEKRREIAAPAQTQTSKASGSAQPGNLPWGSLGLSGTGHSL